MTVPASSRDHSAVDEAGWFVGAGSGLDSAARDRYIDSVDAEPAPGTRPAPWRLLVMTDMAGGLTALLVVAQLVPWLSQQQSQAWSPQSTFVLVCWSALVLMLSAKRVYSRPRRRITPAAADDLGTLLSAVAVAALLVLAVAAVVGAPARRSLPAPAVLVGFAAVALALPLSRAMTLALHSRWVVSPIRVVVVGTGTIAGDVAGRLARSSHVELVGFVDDDPLDGEQVLGDLDALPAICRIEAVDRVVVTFSRSHPGRTADVLRAVPSWVAIDIVPRYFELTGWEAVIDDFSGLAVVSLDGGPPGRMGRAAKRALDIAGGILGLLVVAPLLVPAALAVRLTSSGPVLFRQRRLGRGRRPFEILKLRTMYERPSSHAADRWASGPRSLFEVEEEVSRVTPVGRFLRRFGIDELPQLVNVVRGEMSLVGPRPFVPEECAALPDWAERRFDIRPGMTGLWQVCGQHDLRFDELCRLDAQYVMTWSFTSDLRVLARTPGRLLRGERRVVPLRRTV